MTTKLDKLVSALNQAMNEAMAEADATGTSFSFYPAYGMGGTYYPKKPMSREDALELLRSGRALSAEDAEKIARTLDTDDDSYYGSYEGWRSSSSDC